jgi:UDP-N-acetylmuramoyl-tripeptide--D-alanyl-D-alanine ligase
VLPGDLFFALAGEKFDGHDFLADVAKKGAAAVVVSRSKADRALLLPPTVGVIVVDEPRVALGRLAVSCRAEFQIPIVAVGGSNGKTTTKELIASVLRQKFNTLSSEASFNNDIGVPLTLLNLQSTHEAAVLEAGTNHPGELAPLLRMIQPRHGVLTNIGREHLEFFGDVATVAQEEGTIAELLPGTGVLFLNGDDEWTPRIAQRTRAGVVMVGFGAQNHWRAQNVRVGQNGVSFEVAAPRSECSGEYRIRLVGRHQVPNALLALAVGTELGVSPAEARRGLRDCASPKMRLQAFDAGGVRILDDTYNANADSMRAALQTVADLPCAGRRVAVLGDMAELGGHTIEAHYEIGRRAAELGLDRLIAVGKWSDPTAAAAREMGLREASAFENVEAATAALLYAIRPGDLVLLKASRVTGLERVVEALRARFESGKRES